MKKQSIKIPPDKRFKTPVNSLNNRSNYHCEIDYIEDDNMIVGVNRSNFNLIKPKNFVEFTGFPAISYFIDAYGVFPSTIKYDAKFENYDDFLKKVKAIKNKSFYTESLSNNPIYDVYGDNTGNSEIFKNFLCFHDSKNQLLFYIDITIKGKDESVNKYYCINILSNPKKDSVKVLEFIKSEIFNLPERKNEKTENNHLNILVKGQYGFELEEVNIECPEIDFKLNYNSDFKPIHDLIKQKLSVDKSKGLVLLHGKAGTGKTNYIRYLINNLKKRIIYIPPNMASAISDPELIKFFINYSNSILVIEDAENVLMKRAAHSSQAIANILNLSDGLLSDCVSTQIIATFNTDILNIDSALLRKGRLIAKYEFKELEPEITEKLSKK